MLTGRQWIGGGIAAAALSAHLMDGCPMGSDPRASVVDAHGYHYRAQNLSVLDGSIFRASTGANPQLSIYGITARNASHLGERLTGKAAAQIA